ncbi:MAG: hypothetical protein V2A61_08015, partial [Calditrichota bacterium]
GNMGAGVGVMLTVRNNVPRVLWVPDDYQTIQNAVRGSENGDTVMVRPGTYNESIQLLEKRISIVSSEGPEVTIIDGTNYSVVIWVTGGQDTNTVIRGFTIINSSSEFFPYGIYVELSGPKIVNNILTVPNYFDQVRGGSCIRGDMNSMVVRNNLMVEAGTCVQSYLCWGDVSNNMIMHAYMGFWNSALHGQTLIPDYNLFWDYEFVFNENTRLWGEHNIDNQEPLFEEGSYRLIRGSPGIDKGRPEILDIDGTRSDIGVYGGPYAY